MKINKTVCLDEELIEWLKKENASELINGLLHGHFERKNLRNLTMEQLNKEEEIALLEEKVKELKEAKTW